MWIILLCVLAKMLSRTSLFKFKNCIATAKFISKKLLCLDICCACSYQKYMIPTCRLRSIYNVHIKNQLTLPFVIVRAFCCANHEQNPYSRISRLGFMMHKTESNRLENAQLTRSFISLALKFSANYGFFCEAKQVHSLVMKLGLYEKLSIQNQILHSYVKCGEFGDADKVFDEMPVRNVVSWNTLFSGCVSRVRFGVCYFRRMLLEMVQPDSTTMNALFRSYGVFDDLKMGRQLHGFAMKVGLSSDRFVGCAIVDLYGKLGEVSDAEFAFSELGSRDLVSWNVMVSAYTSNGIVKEAFRVFRSMRVIGVRGDEFTFASLLSSCKLNGCFKLSKQFHGLVIKLSFNLDLKVASSLVDVYAKNGSLKDARNLFDRMVVRNIVSWNTMIVGYGQQGYGKEAVELFVEMVSGYVKPDELTIASIASSCGNLAAINETTTIHAFAIIRGLNVYSSVANSFIVAYSNCGCLASASLCFNSVRKPDLVSWTSILSAHAFHGLVEQSIEIFELMLSSGLRPDNIAFLSVLSACSQGGFIRDGLHYFKLMTMDYNIIPTSEHYACLVDLLGRSGLVEEASSIVSSNPGFLESNALGAFVCVSKSYGHFESAEWAARKLFALEPGNPVNYTLMSNMYASAGQWYEAGRVRKMMKQKCVSKVPGCSWIEITGKTHSFLANEPISS